MNNNTEKKFSNHVSDLLATIIIWFIGAGFVTWGWNTLAPHINCPLFTYWEIFSMRMALSFTMKTIWQK